MLNEIVWRISGDYWDHFVSSRRVELVLEELWISHNRRSASPNIFQCGSNGTYLAAPLAVLDPVSLERQIRRISFRLPDTGNYIFKSVSAVDRMRVLSSSLMTLLDLRSQTSLSLLIVKLVVDVPVDYSYHNFTNVTLLSCVPPSQCRGG